MCYSEGSAMNRQQFLEQLEAELSGLAPVERQEALKFYVEYLDEAGPENEAAVLAELGSPQKVAAIIRANLGLSDESAAPHETPKPSLTLNGPDWSRKTEQQAQSGAPGAGSAAYGGQPFPKSKNNSRVLLVLLLVFTRPLWIGILGGPVSYPHLPHRRQHPDTGADNRASAPAPFRRVRCFGGRSSVQ